MSLTILHSPEQIRARPQLHPQFVCGTFQVGGKYKSVGGNAKQRRSRVRFWKREGHVVIQYVFNGRSSMPTKVR